MCHKPLLENLLSSGAWIHVYW